MRIRFLVLPALALLAIAGLAAACGGDDSGDKQPSGIKTQKGLSVAAIGALQAGAGNESGDLAADTSRNGTGNSAAPAADKSIGNGISTYPLAPQLQQGGGGVTVQGYGSATAPADSAAVEFYFSNYGGDVKPDPGLPVPDASSSSSGSSGSGSSVDGTTRDSVAPQQAQAITEAQLQPVIDAITGAGVARDDIEFVSQGYDIYYSGATLRAAVNNVDSVDSVVQAASNAAAGLTSISLNGTNISYSVSDCSALEQAAMQAAVSDAGDRATAFAQALGVGLGAITGASNYSYSPYGGSPCGTSGGIPYPLGGEVYAAGQDQEVHVFAQISVTYGLQ